jgi:hypothetical protein
MSAAIVYVVSIQVTLQIGIHGIEISVIGAGGETVGQCKRQPKPDPHVVEPR